ncbi:MAG: CDP-alcohol phosphatidyltransferase family protein [candidate division NC10 bacterium]|nr:CDP-alcohol phosphatidyltransferase family protein [candidate division NC10 bacterium]
MLTLANRLTILRILMVPLIITLLLYRIMDYALAIFCLAGLTDALDGFIARSFRQKTALGMILDPLADKLLLTSSLLTLAFLREVPRWFAIVVVSRDLILIGGALVLLLFAGKVGIPPSILGKVTTGFQLLTAFFAMLDNFVPPLHPTIFPLVFTTAVCTILSGLDYVYRGARLLDGH